MYMCAKEISIAFYHSQYSDMVTFTDNDHLFYDVLKIRIQFYRYEDPL